MILEGKLDPPSSTVSMIGSISIPGKPRVCNSSTTNIEMFSGWLENGRNPVRRSLGFSTASGTITHSSHFLCCGRRHILQFQMLALLVSEDYVVQLEEEIEDESSTLGVVSAIWGELSGGIGPWGAARPLFAFALAMVPLLFLGQHFNRQHRKASEWFLIQFPLILSLVLWPVLYVWSIADAWWVSSGIVASAKNKESLESLGNL